MKSLDTKLVEIKQDRGSCVFVSTEAKGAGRAFDAHTMRLRLGTRCVRLSLA
jgi:hypothetical protein